MEIFDLTGATPLKPNNCQNNKSSPLKQTNRNLISNLAKKLEKVGTLVQKESSRSSSIPPPIPPKVVAPNICPVCERKFKNERGVKQHRARSMACGVDKENNEDDHDADATKEVSDNNNDDSIIVIDTLPTTYYY